jgi:tetratricopeptide (TPR) repeat protein
MDAILLSLLSALLSTNQVVAVSNVVARTTGIALPVVDPNDPVEKDFQRLLAEDDAAQAEVDQWIKDNNSFGEKGAGIPAATLNARIDQRFEPVVRGYEDFLLRHPEHARARLAYGSFLNDISRETEAMVQWERARELEPNNPAAWNNLAIYFSHRGPVKKAFAYYAKAIELNPIEPLYYQNLATCVFSYRKDAKEFYQLDDDQKVFRRALALYRQARKLDPQNFALATDLAQTYYYLEPPQLADKQAADLAEKQLLEEAFCAWQDAQKIALDDGQREGVFIHLARLCITHRRFEEARRHLAAVTRPEYGVLKQRLTRNLEQKQKEAAQQPPAVGK